MDSETLDASVLLAAIADRDAYLLYMLGREAEHRPRLVENIDEAINYYNQALEMDSDYPAAHAGLCSAHVSLYELNKDSSSISTAEDACASAMRVAPRLSVVLNSVGRLYRQTDRRDDAEQAYLGALAINEQDADALQGLARIRRSQQRYEEAEQMMRRAIELQPGNWKAINNLGELHDAVTTLQRSVQLAPNSNGPWISLGDALYVSGNVEDASTAYARARDLAAEQLRVSGDDVDLLTTLAWSTAMTGDIDRAVELSQRTVDVARRGSARRCVVVAATSALQTTYPSRCLCRRGERFANSRTRHVLAAG